MTNKNWEGTIPRNTLRKKHEAGISTSFETGRNRFSLFSLSEKQCIIKQLLDSVFVISGIMTLIIPDITKTSSNNCLLLTYRSRCDFFFIIYIVTALLSISRNLHSKACNKYETTPSSHHRWWPTSHHRWPHAADINNGFNHTTTNLSWRVRVKNLYNWQILKSVGRTPRLLFKFFRVYDEFFI